MSRENGRRQGRTFARPCREALRHLWLVVSLPVIVACSASPSDTERDQHDRQTTPTLVGEQIYLCDDGTALHADFLDEGLTLDLSDRPGGRPMRLTAPATGLSFVGDGTTLSFVGADRILFAQIEREDLRCQRARRSAGPLPNDPRPDREGPAPSPSAPPSHSKGPRQ